MSHAFLIIILTAGVTECQNIGSRLFQLIHRGLIHRGPGHGLMHFQEKKNKKSVPWRQTVSDHYPLLFQAFDYPLRWNQPFHGEESSIISGLRTLIACRVHLSLLLFQFQIREF